jgi:hypothetical protein
MRLNGSDLDIPTPKRKLKKGPKTDRRALGLPFANRDGTNFATDPLGPYSFDPGPGFERVGFETPEQRAFRRYPITSHKPGPHICPDCGRVWEVAHGNCRA